MLKKHFNTLNIQWSLFNETFEKAIGYTGASRNWQDAFILDLVQATKRFFEEGLHSFADTLNELAQTRFFEIEGDYLGFSPLKILERDSRYVIHGCGYPVILWKRGSHFVFIGVCYVFGLMGGEAGEFVGNGPGKENIESLHIK